MECSYGEGINCRGVVKYYLEKDNGEKVVTCVAHLRYFLFLKDNSFRRGGFIDSEGNPEEKEGLIEIFRSEFLKLEKLEDIKNKPTDSTKLLGFNFLRSFP